MFRPRSSLFAISLSAFTLALAAGCSGFSEQPILNQFFTASRLRDNTSLNNITMVSFEPRTQGTVTTFDIVSVTPERRTATVAATMYPVPRRQKRPVGRSTLSSVTSRHEISRRRARVASRRAVLAT